MDGIGPAMDEAFSVLMAAGVLQQQFAPTVLSVPSSRFEQAHAHRFVISGSAVLARARRHGLREGCDRGAPRTPSSSASRRKASRALCALGIVSSRRRVVRLDAATGACAGAHGRRDGSGAGVGLSRAARNPVHFFSTASGHFCSSASTRQAYNDLLVFQLASVLLALANRAAKASKSVLYGEGRSIVQPSVGLYRGASVFTAVLHLYCRGYA